VLIFLAKPDAEEIVSHHLLNFVINPAPIYMHINATYFPELYCMLMYFQFAISSCYQCSFLNIGNTHWCKYNFFLLSQHILVRNHNIAMHPTEVIFVLHFRSSISSFLYSFCCISDVVSAIVEGHRKQVDCLTTTQISRTRTKLDVRSWSGFVYEQRNGVGRDREVYLYLSSILTSTEASVKLLYSNWKYTYEWDEPFAAKLLYLHFQFLVSETTLMLV